ncbi:amidohydrolase 3 [Ilyonectria robusta]|uniref:amidohydrolase 3 n=1 Tax=Ilyonectria robusta TaxID=1079257 RepID=UPI001E8D5E0B|nr:amidohydrolase 3 [Ilyonectria robusta]KAH8673179.1 amidohydrolase 3 [Ilyonectria robusta]
MTTLSSKSLANSVAYFNGRVYTIDTRQPWAEAFIVTATGIFEAVGSDTEILSIAKKRMLVQFDLRQKFVMPGIHDAHSHMYMGSTMQLNESTMNLEIPDSKIGEKLHHGHCMCSYYGVRDDWVIGNSYGAFNFADSIPDRRYLDGIWPDQPVFLREVSAHKLLLNTAALKRLGIDDSIVDPPAGAFVRRSDGTLTGELLESATGLVWDNLPKPALAHVKRALEHGMSVCHRYGITSAQEAIANTAYLHALHELEFENRLNLDMYTHIMSAPAAIAEESEESLISLLNIAEGFRTKHIHPQFVKFVLDGAPIPPHLTQADLDEDGRTCEENIYVDRETLLTRMKLFDSRGMTCKLHAAGEGSVRMALEVIEKLRESNKDGPRHEIAHCNSVHADDIRRFAPLRITAEMSPAIFHQPLLFESVPHLGNWNFNGFLSSNMLMTIGSDWAVVPTPELFPALTGIVEKIHGFEDDNTTDGDGLTDLQRGGRILCRVITLGGAEAVGANHRTGSIEVGKKANFIAVNQDLSEGHFKDAKVLQTWFEGRIVFSARSDGMPSL